MDIHEDECVQSNEGFGGSACWAWESEFIKNLKNISFVTSEKQMSILNKIVEEYRSVFQRECNVG